MSGFNLSALAVRERAVTLFLIIALVAVGAFSYLALGRAEDPPFTVKTFTVIATWPGATAQEMQDLVADPLEKRMQELEWYDRVETYTRPGLAALSVTLRDTTPPGEVPNQFYQARKKLGDTVHSLPAGVQGPFINDEYSDVDFTVYALDGHGLPERQLVRVAETLRQRLLHVPGVKKVDIMGERPERIFVELDYAHLATLGIAPQDVFANLSRLNAVTPAGSIDTSGPQVYLRLDGALDDLEAIRETPIVSGGRSFRLVDIATVRRGYEDPPTLLVRHDGEPSLVLNVVMADGWNGLKLGRALSAEEAKLQSALPVGVTLTKVIDQAAVIRDAIDEFMFKFFVALAIVLGVSLFTLGWRVGLVVAAAVPLTLATVLAIMLITGRELDRITLGALIISLGLLVDDAIIAIEIMVVRLEQGADRIAAASHAWSHTAAPMLAGTLVTIAGFLPVGFARSTAGEYAGNIFWIVAFALITSWVVAVVFTPYLGVKMLPAIKRVESGAHRDLYATPNYRRLRRVVGWSVRHKFVVAGAVIVLFLVAVPGLGAVKQQFFPDSDRTEVLIEVQMPEGTSIEATSDVAARVEAWLKTQPEAKVVTTYVGGGAPRFFLAYNPELPDPSFAKMIVGTPDDAARDRLTLHLRQRVAEGLAPEARIRVTQFVFGPYSHFPVMMRVMGPDSGAVRSLAAEVTAAMRANPHTRQVNTDWGERVPTAHFVLDQTRLQLIGLSPSEVATQLQFLLTGIVVTQLRHDVRTVDLVARSAGGTRLDPDRLQDLTLTNRDGTLIPLAQIGHIEVRPEDPILRRRDRVPTITVQSDIDEGVQPPQVSMEVAKSLAPLIARLPEGYRIELGGNIEEAGKANRALVPIFPVMLLVTLLILVIQTRSLSGMIMVVLTAPLGLIGAVPVLLLFNQPFGFNAILGLIGLAGIIMRNTLILIGQIHDNEKAGLDPFHAVVEATVQRSRPVLLTALAAVLAFAELTTSVFWGSMAYVLVGGTLAGTVLILVFLPALYAIWYRVTDRSQSGIAPTPAADVVPGTARMHA
ncbi:efflux RND transporter permease subunit [Acidisphaera rubrifaciens]|uniref:Acriflavin resistance protein/heavy metal efflux pump CzcA n=1 Tax=Acidisphaera rubrifaciens HS-AP3 TaxID=1231350 RepID=A0A0D6P692_9PROT|nr:efflux RND transporter permease subunit [Acidisphaera rubrifaciens]GAN77280.1 acriflavin resistance protein/heavy metal efflux pump CzcA [Acidisphaera rubrifaciens HS-AP3]